MRDRMVTVGQIAGPFGVLGWVKVRSHTDPPKNILKYAPWVLKGLDRLSRLKSSRVGPKAEKWLQGLKALPIVTRPWP
jgi:ribosomal 30S subunit maturation factor RimM